MIGFIIFAVIAVCAVVFVCIYLLNRGKKCKNCGEAYDSSCVLEAKSLGVKNAVLFYVTDVMLRAKCKKCGKEAVVKTTLKFDRYDDRMADPGTLSDKAFEKALKRHFGEEVEKD